MSRCVAPYETARTLAKGSVEFTGSVTHVRGFLEGDNGKLDNGFGIGMGVGVSKKFNLKIRYERIAAVDESLNFIGFGPKIGLRRDKIALALPVWCYYNDLERTWGTSPTMIFRVTPASRIFETNIGVRGDFFPFENNSDLLLGLNLGFGISTDLDRWAIRPDLGLVINTQERGSIFSFGLGAQVLLGPEQK